MKSKIGLGLVLAFILLLSSTFVLTSQAWYTSTDPWSQTQHNSQHTGMGTSIAPSSNSTTWTHPDEFGFGSPNALVVADGRVFVLSGDVFYVLDETTGALVLSYKNPGISITDGPAYSNGKLILTGGSGSTGRILCYNATTGNPLWFYDTSPGIIQHTPTVSGNRVYAGTTNNYLYCVEDGVQKWNKTLGGPIYSSPAVDGDLLCIGCDDGKLYAFDIAGAQPVSVWNFTVGTAIRTAITIQGDKVYCTSSNSDLYVLDRTNGSLVWSWKAYGNYYLDIAVAYGIVYIGVKAFGQSAHPIYALYTNATAGNYTYASTEPRLWSDGTVGPTYIGLTVSGNKIFYCSSFSNMLFARNALTGVHLWNYTLIGPSTTPIIADGHVFVADVNNIHCIGASYPPITNTYNLNVGGQAFTVTARTNSTMDNIDTSDITTTKNMSFTVESSQGTGMCNITLPNSLLGGPYALTVGGQPPWNSANTALNSTHTALYFTYNGTGKYTAQITGTTAIPEFSAPIMILLFGILTLTVALLKKAHATGKSQVRKIKFQ